MRRTGRVLVLTNRFPVGPGDYAGWYVAKHSEVHRRLGWSVRVVAPHRVGGFPLWRYSMMALRLAPRLLRRDFDLVHAHWILPSGLLGLMIARTSGRPLVITSHGAFVRRFWDHPWLERFLVRRVLMGADWVIGVGREHVGQIRAIVPEAALRVSQNDMGIDLDLPEGQTGETRSGLGVTPEAFLVLFVGNLERRKGVDVLLKACGIMTAQRVDLELRVVGRGPALPELMQQCEHLGMDVDRVFVGSIPHQQVGDYYRAADVVVVPSRDEPSGLVAMEAMAAGGVVIASEVGGLKESVQDGRTGLLFPSGDAEALAGAIRRVWESSALESDLRRQGAQVGAAFDIRQRAAVVEGIYRHLLGMPEEEA